MKDRRGLIKQNLTKTSLEGTL